MSMAIVAAAFCRSSGGRPGPSLAVPCRRRNRALKTVRSQAVGSEARFRWIDITATGRDPPFRRCYVIE